MNSPESTALDGDNPTMDTFTAVPTPSTSTLEGIPNVNEQLLDLVLPQPGSVQENKLPVNMGNTEEDLEAASTLLSLGDTLEDPLDEGEENALLMPIGGATVPEDVTPPPYEGCKFRTATKKQLKEHQKRHYDDFPYECKICHKGFHYRSGLKRHHDKEHKNE